MKHSPKTLQETAQFWNQNPCDGFDHVSDRMTYRYKKDPWLFALFEKLVATQGNFLEVGCGQGTDAIRICQQLHEDSRYTAVDCSAASVKSAQASLQIMKNSCQVIPEFSIADAEQLPFGDELFDTVYSCGVIHHSPNTRKAAKELIRVLKKDGHGYVTIYRCWSPKVLVAHLLRFFSKILDNILLQDRLIYRFLKGRSPDFIGTNLEECFGVPILRSYTLKDVCQLFPDVKIVDVKPVGLGLPGITRLSKLEIFSQKILGYMWLVHFTKK